MLIGLHDAEKDHIKGKTFPNYALMKISTWHKARGDIVKWWNPLESAEFDKVYSSKIFDFTPENPYLPENTVKGGTGYNVKVKLPPEIDACFPDYSIYPKCDYSIGFITRGCPNKCPWCVVPEKEGIITTYRLLREVVRTDTDKVVLMDNNILASRYGVWELERAAKQGYKLDVNQGMDARLVDERIADIIARIMWIKYIRFSCDTDEQIGAIFNAAELLKKHGIKPYRLFIYLLVTKDIDAAAARVEKLRELKGISLYAQAERNERKGIRPNAAQLEFTQRYIYSKIYHKETWREYCEKRDLHYKKL